jgi:hypothetical protein
MMGTSGCLASGRSDRAGVAYFEDGRSANLASGDGEDVGHVVSRQRRRLADGPTMAPTSLAPRRAPRCSVLRRSSRNRNAGVAQPDQNSEWAVTRPECEKGCLVETCPYRSRSGQRIPKRTFTTTSTPFRKVIQLLLDGDPRAGVTLRDGFSKLLAP